MSDAEVLEGYHDGRDPNSPEPSANRSASYRFGFQNGRDDLAGQPRAFAGMIRAEGQAAEREDASR